MTSLDKTFCVNNKCDKEYCPIRLSNQNKKLNELLGLKPLYALDFRGSYRASSIPELKKYYNPSEVAWKTWEETILTLEVDFTLPKNFITLLNIVYKTTGFDMNQVCYFKLDLDEKEVTGSFQGDFLALLVKEIPIYKEDQLMFKGDWIDRFIKACQQEKWKR